jgi:hypothetical protein
MQYRWRQVRHKVAVGGLEGRQGSEAFYGSLACPSYFCDVPEAVVDLAVGRSSPTIRACRLTFAAVKPLASAMGI